jgi:hypothetical protein
MPLVDLSDDETARNFSDALGPEPSSVTRTRCHSTVTGSIDDDHLYDAQISSEQAGRTQHCHPCALPAEGLDEMSNIKLVRDIASKMLNRRDTPYPWYIPGAAGAPDHQGPAPPVKERDGFEGHITVSRFRGGRSSWRLMRTNESFSLASMP